MATKKDRLVTREPICSRNSHVFGQIDLFEPVAHHSEWHNLPWVLLTEKGGIDDAPIKLRVKGQFAWQAYERPSLTPKEHLY